MNLSCRTWSALVPTNRVFQAGLAGQQCWICPCFACCRHGRKSLRKTVAPAANSVKQLTSQMSGRSETSKGLLLNQLTFYYTYPFANTQQITFALFLVLCSWPMATPLLWTCSMRAEGWRSQWPCHCRWLPVGGSCSFLNFLLYVCYWKCLRACVTTPTLQPILSYRWASVQQTLRESGFSPKWTMCGYECMSWQCLHTW